MSTVRKLVSLALVAAAAFLVSLALVVASSATGASAAGSGFWPTLLQVFGLLLLAGVLAGLSVREPALRVMAVYRNRLEKIHRRGRDTHRRLTGRDWANLTRLAATGAAPAAPRRKIDAGSVLSRLEAAERRLLSSVDTARLSHDDRLAALESRMDTLGTPVADGAGGSLATVQNTLRNHTTESSRDVVRQVEALLQLTARVDTANRRFPASGGWAMDAEGLLLLSDLITAHRPRRILEVGSGVSSCWMGEFARRHGGTVVTLEHQQEYAEKTRRSLGELGLQDTVEVRVAELEEISLGDRTYRWYDPQALADLQDIEMVVVDGPPKKTGEDARFPALPLLAGRLAPGCLVVVDDFHRPDEQRIVDQWLEQFPEFELVGLDTHRTGLLRRRGDGKPSSQPLGSGL
jgi:predicted O-methyltransferase YrrM